MTQPVTIYTLPKCGLCQDAKEYFIKHKIKFKSVNVDSNPEAQAEMITKSGQYSVPVIDINGQIIVGFQKELLDALLAS
jgi:glutaredoxin-like YruB-family protein